MVEAIIRTRSLRGGHYRATVRHPKEGKDWPPGTFTEEQLAALEADPDLEVEVLEAPEGSAPVVESHAQVETGGEPERQATGEAAEEEPAPEPKPKKGKKD